MGLDYVFLSSIKFQVICRLLLSFQVHSALTRFVLGKHDDDVFLKSVLMKKFQFNLSSAR